MALAIDLQILSLKNSFEEATLLCPNLQIYEYNLNDIILPPPTPALIRIGKHPTHHEYYLHHLNTTVKAFLTKRINDWILHTRPSTSQLSSLSWSDLTWTVAGSTINKYSKNSPSMKTFLMKVLYDALPNDYTKYKYAIKTSLDNLPTPIDPNLPPCPLCATSNDSLSHLLCNCTHPTILTYRTQLIHQLNKLKYHSHIDSPHFPAIHQITSILLANIDSPHPDHRNLLGLFHIPSLPSPLPPYQPCAKHYTK